MPDADRAALDADLLKLPVSLPPEPQEEREPTPEPSDAAVKVTLTYTPGTGGKPANIEAELDGGRCISTARWSPRKRNIETG